MAAVCACRFVDPGYYEGDPEDEDAPDPLTAALPNKAAYQHIRALPCAAGSACIFTHRYGMQTCSSCSFVLVECMACSRIAVIN
jgi:hypothetical protein